ncbi:MAG TPA: hypothetical protein VGD30_06470 [Telluria sp.]
MNIAKHMEAIFIAAAVLACAAAYTFNSLPTTATGNGTLTYEAGSQRISATLQLKLSS